MGCCSVVVFYSPSFTSSRIVRFETKLKKSMASVSTKSHGVLPTNTGILSISHSYQDGQMKKCQTISLRFTCHDRVSHTTLCMYSVYESMIYIYTHIYTYIYMFLWIYVYKYIYIYCIDMYMHVSLHVRWGLLDFMSAVPPPSPPPPPPPSDLNCKRYSSVPGRTPPASAKR